MMTKSYIRKAILRGAAKEIGLILMDSEGKHLNPRESQRFRDAENGIVRYRPDQWIGRPLTNAERIAVSRELESMWIEGLVERFSVGGGNRTDFLKIVGSATAK